MVSVQEVITKNKNVLGVIKSIVSKQDIFSQDQLLEILKKKGIEVKKSTLRNYIQELTSSHDIFSIKKGMYSTAQKKNFIPEISKKLHKIYRFVSKNLIIDHSCVWETSWVHEFMVMQPRGTRIILEVDRDMQESIYYKIKDNIYKRVFIAPDEKELHLYLSEEVEPLIILPIISRSPLMTVCGLIIPRIEKILVDIYSNPAFFYWMQGQELINIYSNAYEKYKINFSVLFSYAQRRGVITELKQFISDNLNIPEDISK